MENTTQPPKRVRTKTLERIYEKIMKKKQQDFVEKKKQDEILEHTLTTILSENASIPEDTPFEKVDTENLLSVRKATANTIAKMKRYAVLEEVVSNIISNKLTGKDLNRFVANEFISIYKGIGGRKKLMNYFREKPAELVNLLKNISSIANDLLESEKVSVSENVNKGVILQFSGVNPPTTINNTIPVKAEEKEIVVG